MPGVLTEAAVLRCAHQGTVLVQAGTRSLTVDGSAVLLPDDVLAGQVLGCQLKPVPCTTIATINAGFSTTLAIDGRPVLLATAQGATNAGLWQVIDAGQTKLEAA